MNFDQFQSYYLVGVKGVAMTSIAQVLLDAGKSVRGSDTAEDFVTAEVLKKLNITIDSGFTASIPDDCQCVIYTAAHKGAYNPQVIAAKDRGLPVFSQAEALSSFFNAKKGIAVCGVGGKSTTSAMITWILEKTGRNPSFSVGVGKIVGMEKTGAWRSDSEYFVAEADEYVTDPSAPSRGEAITPRFSYLHPFVTICTNYRYDHPDVYATPADTFAAFQAFFNQINPQGTLIINQHDLSTIPTQTTAHQTITFGELGKADFSIMTEKTELSEGITKSVFYDAQDHQEYAITLTLPGTYNLENAAYAVLACKIIGVPVAESCAALASFSSTLRRFEKIGEKQGVLYYDDYAHHPNEVRSVIEALRGWYPHRRIVIAFQSHTYSRTKQLFSEFVTAFAAAQEVVMIDIFASAREQFDPSISTDMLVAAIKEQYPEIQIENVKTIPALANYLRSHLQPGDICITIGAGDIYTVHKLLE
ncbi:UDP-N-acetylmuramate--L-alanine ligase [Candidatus Woesebacteria bacterium]|nr:UDP-N-acetylmuramate--L-alanine ligase [Candidatus Woesebacteria bacterium]